MPRESFEAPLRRSVQCSVVFVSYMGIFRSCPIARSHINVDQGPISQFGAHAAHFWFRFTVPCVPLTVAPQASLQ